MATQQFHSKVSGEGGTAGSEFLTKTQIDTLIADAKARANHTGTQTASTISDFTSAVNTLIGAVIDGAPGALDTLNELAAALGDDANFAATTATALAALDTRLDTLEAAPGGGYSATVGDGAASTYAITHNLNGHVLYQVRRVSTGLYENVPAVHTSANVLTLDFGATVPASAAFRVMIYKVG